MNLRKTASDRSLFKLNNNGKAREIPRSSSYSVLGKELMSSSLEKVLRKAEEKKDIFASFIQPKILELGDSSKQNICRKLMEIDYLTFTIVGVALPSTTNQGSIYWNWIDGALSAGVGLHQLWKSRSYSYYKQSTQLKGAINFLSGMQSLALSTSVFCHALPVWGPYLAFSISMLCDLIELLIDFYHISCLKNEAKGQEKELIDLLDNMYEKTRNNLIAKAFGLTGAIFLTVAAFHISAPIFTMIGTVLGALTAAYYLLKHAETALIETEKGRYLKQKVMSCVSTFFQTERKTISERVISITPTLRPVIS